MLTPLTKSLLYTLAQLDPKRFTCNTDEEHGGELWSFTDNKTHEVVDDERPPERWLLRFIEKSKGNTFHILYRHEHRTWTDSILEQIIAEKRGW